MSLIGRDGDVEFDALRYTGMLTSPNWLYGFSIPLTTNKQREKERPRFERVDGQFCREEEKLRRFNITIQSVHYYLHEDGVRCAVLLTTAFDLADQEKLGKFTPVALVTTNSLWFHFKKPPPSFL